MTVESTATRGSLPSAFESLSRALRSWRTLSVVLLSFSSGLPLGLVWYAIPDWMRDIGVDIRLVGLITLAQAPWAFKVIWSPLMDRYAPPFWGRRRGWMAVTQIALFVVGLMLAGVGSHPDTIWVVGALALAIAFASASQDIAIDAYAVEVLRKDEQGTASGARTALYRGALAISGGVSITMAAHVGWGFVNAALAVLYLPMLILTWKAPEPEERISAPRSLRDAVWQPFIGFLSRDRAIEILAFVVLYKFADQLAQALTRPFLIDMGYNADHRGIALATVGLAGTLIGTFVGGWITTLIGLGHSLWAFGVLQIFSNFGYFLVAQAAPNPPLMYGAVAFEMLTSGFSTGAFSVLLLRLTEKRFSATQYALFSSLFALPRLVAGPITGFAVDALGWSTFYLATMVVGLPGLLMLSRFAPPGVREPEFVVIAQPPEQGHRWGPALAGPVRQSTPGGVRLQPDGRAIAGRGVAGGVIVGAGAFFVVALLAALKTMREDPRRLFRFGDAMRAVMNPTDVAGWVQLAGVTTVAVIGGVFAAAASAASRR